jgi:hypothetical protein
MRQSERGAQVLAELNPMLVWDRHKDFDHLGVKLRTGAAANLFAGVGHGQRFAVGTVADHRVERIRHREYSGTERDLFLF